MKRSEAVVKLNNYLCSLLFKEAPKEPDGSWDSYKNAEEILEVIEEMGMLPPEVNWNEGNGAGIPSYCTNEWEPE